jgi:hypothetical protein
MVAIEIHFAENSGDQLVLYAEEHRWLYSVIVM